MGCTAEFWCTWNFISVKGFVAKIYHISITQPGGEEEMNNCSLVIVCQDGIELLRQMEIIKKLLTDVFV